MRMLIKRLCVTTIIAALLLLNIVGGFPLKGVKAVEDIAATYLNTTMKYLYLGVPGKTEFDFNITDKAISKGATYSWYVNEEKGNPEAISIDEATGKVTALEAGTCYVGCKITKLDGTEIYPEAKVTVINNITKVGFRRIPADNTILVGVPFYLDYKILNTQAGKNATTKAVVKYDIEEISTWTECSDQGVLVAYKEGELKIRAVCFQNEENYKRWLRNKSVNNSLLTASSEWVTLKVVAQADEAIAQNQTQLEELLKLNTVQQVIIRTDKEQTLTIPKGLYPEKTLMVDAPNVGITNYGEFRLITINDMTTHVWKECAMENQIVVNSEYINIKIEKDASLKSLLTGAKTKLGYIKVEGTITTIYLNVPMRLLLPPVIIVH